MKSGRITAVHRDAKNQHRYHIQIGDEVVFSVHEDILVKYQLLKGTELDEAFCREVLLAEEEHKAYLLALRYLGIRPRTKKQVASYLREKGYAADVADEICRRMEEQGYLDDERFARQWVDERLRLKPRSPYMMRMELQQRGIDSDTADAAVRAVSREDELEAARRLVEKKRRHRQGPPEPDEERKLLAMLARKGFSGSIVQQIRRELREDGGS